MITLNDRQIDTLHNKGVREGDYIPNTSLKLNALGQLEGSQSFTPTRQAPAPTTQSSTVGGTVPTQGATTPTQQPLGTVLSIGQDPWMAEYDERAMRYRDQADAVIDPNQIYQDQLRMYQAEIDAVNELYRSHLQEAQRQGRGRLGSSTALQARSGLLGSDFGQAQTDEMQRYNLDIEGGIRAEQRAKIGAIMGEVRQSTVRELEQKRAAKEQGAEAYMQFLTEKSSRRQTEMQRIAQMVLEGELDPEEVNWDETLKGSGLKWDDIKPIYDGMERDYRAAQAEAQMAQMERDAKLRKTEAEISKIESDIENGNVVRLGEGDMLYDTRTGQFFKNPKTFAPTSTRTQQITSGGVTIAPEALSEISQRLSQARGEDMYTDVNTYNDALMRWEQSGALSQDFFKYFPPEEYLNPEESAKLVENRMKLKSDKNAAPWYLDLLYGATPTDGRNLTPTG